MQSVLWATGWRWNVNLSSSFTKMLSDLSSPTIKSVEMIHQLMTAWYLLFQACFTCASRWTYGMSRSISSRVGILFSPFATPDLTAAARAPAPPSRCEWRIPRDTLPPMLEDFLVFSFDTAPSFLSFLSLLLLTLLEEDRRFKELTEDTEGEDVESDVVFLFDLKEN